MNQAGYRPSEAMVDISLMVHLTLMVYIFEQLTEKMNDLCYIIGILYENMMSNSSMASLLFNKMTKFLLCNQTWKLNRPLGRFTVKSTSNVIINVQLKTFILLTDRLAYNINKNLFTKITHMTERYQRRIHKIAIFIFAKLLQSKICLFLKLCKTPVPWRLLNCPCAPPLLSSRLRWSCFCQDRPSASTPWKSS